MLLSSVLCSALLDSNFFSQYVFSIVTITVKPHILSRDGSVALDPEQPEGEANTRIVNGAVATVWVHVT